MFRRVRPNWHQILYSVHCVGISLLLLGESCVATGDALPSVIESPEMFSTDMLVQEELPSKASILRPYFDDVGPRNITAIEGLSAILKCKVKYSGNRTISWMRKRDLHILTSSVHTYTGDERFSVVHAEQSDNWDLRIEPVQKKDAGVYECQINTEPKINMAVLLTVEDAQARIWGSQDVYVKEGSTISLTCSINIHSNPPSSVQWFHGTNVVDFDSQRGGISLDTEKTESGTTSKLLVTKATFRDSGNYTCIPTLANPASVFVHVIDGENSAAMQKSKSSSLHNTSLVLTFTAVNLLILLLR